MIMSNEDSKFSPIVHLKHKFPNRYFLLAVLPVNHDFDIGRVRFFPPDGFVDCLEVGRYLVGDCILSLRRQVAGGLITVTSVTGSTTPGSPWSASTQRPYSSNSYRSYVFAYDLAGLDLLIRDDIPFCEHNIKFMTSGFVGQTFPNCIVADTPSDLRRKVQGMLETSTLTEVVYRPDKYKPFQGLANYTNEFVYGHVAYLVSDYRDECTLVYRVPGD